MRRVFSLGVMVVCAIVVWACSSVVEAQPISRNNPFRGFNLSGVNYGSQQWEREHRGKAAPTRSRPVLRPLFRGR